MQEAAAALVAQLGEYTITLTALEDNLLQRLANSQVRLGTQPLYLRVPWLYCWLSQL